MAKKKNNNNKYLSLQEEIECGRIIKGFREGKEGFTEEDYHLALEKLWEGNKKGVYKIVHNFFRYFSASHYYPLDEAIADATTEFCRFCSQKYDPERGFKVMTGATLWIKKVLRETSGQYRRFPLKGKSACQLVEISKSIVHYEQNLELKNQISLQEYLEQQHKNIKKKDIFNFSSMHYGISSFDYTIADNTKMADVVGDSSQESVLDNICKREVVSVLLANLSEIERTVIQLEYGLEYTGYKSVNEYIKAVGISRKQFTTYLYSALDKIKQIVQERNLQLCDVLQ